MMFYMEMPSPIGRLTLTANEKALTGIYFEGEQVPPADGRENRPSHSALKTARRQLEEYFASRRRSFDIPLAPEGTAFRRRVWKALERIPYGETRSYGDIARSIRNPKAARAVGAANGANPIPIVVPCHRVIGADGTLTGYGGGLWRKGMLLALERQR
ncbi:MAG: methylated-DNA--[protein]-cysteine S-methyltransferase [Gammaproteobacteria bacterium]